MSEDFARLAKEASGKKAPVRKVIDAQRVRVQASLAAGASERAIYRLLGEEGLNVGRDFSSFNKALKWLMEHSPDWSEARPAPAKPAKAVSQGDAMFTDPRFKSDY